MNLADHRIAGDGAQFLGDLAGGLAFGPHLLERLDALIGPGHGQNSAIAAVAASLAEFWVSSCGLAMVEE